MCIYIYVYIHIYASKDVLTPTTHTHTQCFESVWSYAFFLSISANTASRALAATLQKDDACIARTSLAIPFVVTIVDLVLNEFRITFHIALFGKIVAVQFLHGARLNINKSFAKMAGSHANEIERSPNRTCTPIMACTGPRNKGAIYGREDARAC